MRPGHPNANWGYWSTDALGLFEFMQVRLKSKHQLLPSASCKCLNQ